MKNISIGQTAVMDQNPRILTRRPSRHPSPVTRHLFAFTLIELLVVIAIIGILAALLLPVLGRAKVAAQKRKAQMEIGQIVNAIQRYNTTYSRYPTMQTPGTGDFTYGGTSYALILNSNLTGLPAGTQWTNNNDEVVAILMDLDKYPVTGNPTVNSGHVKNTQQIKFLSATMAQDTNSPGVGPDLVYRDPWGNPYIISMDLNYNENTQDAFYMLHNVSFQSSAASGINGLTDFSDPTGVANDFEYHGGVMVWSLGPDKKADATKAANVDVNKDNVTSWGQ